MPAQDNRNQPSLPSSSLERKSEPIAEKPETPTAPQGDPVLKNSQIAVEEMHPDLSYRERGKIGLLLHTQEEKAEYLQKIGFKVEVDGDRRFLISKEGDKLKYRLDPQTGALSQDFAGDLIDESGSLITYSSGAVALGTKTAGALLAPLTGMSSIGAGMAIGGAVTGGTEAALQTTGKAWGVREEADYSQIAKATAVGATFPVAGNILSKAGSWASEFVSGFVNVNRLPRVIQNKIPVFRVVEEQFAGMPGKYSPVQNWSVGKAGFNEWSASHVREGTAVMRSTIGSLRNAGNVEIHHGGTKLYCSAEKSLVPGIDFGFIK